MRKSRHRSPRGFNSARTYAEPRSRGLALVAALILLIALNSLGYLIPINLLDYFGPGEGDRNNLINYAPEVWLSLLALVFGTLIIVISIASESTPKLIDLFVGDYKSRLFIWLITLSGLENITLQLVHRQNTTFFDNLIFLNNYALLPGFVMLSIPYIFYILKYTKNSNVIEKIFDENRAAIKTAARIKNTRTEIGENQYNLFETINQLHDLLQHARFKEPKADIIHKFGKSLRFYISRKKSLPDSYFVLSEQIKNDISFKTLKDRFQKVENEHTFYEQKVLRVFGTSYLLLMEDGHYDLASLCGHELFETGRTAGEFNDNRAMDAVILHFNTLLRHGMNHGLKTREIKNVYNTIFHYSQLVDFLIKKNEVERVVECCKYFVFYGKEVSRLSKTERSFVFLIDSFATEMRRILMTMYGSGFQRELQEKVLTMFNEINSSEVVGPDHQPSGQSYRLIQISLCLYYIEVNEHSFKELTTDCIIRAFSGLDHETARRTITTDCDRLKEEREEFWEDTDQGNGNIFYTPHSHQLPGFHSYFVSRLDSQLS